ncbi:MAG TPA: hypothetical protein VJ850_12030 [Candidatus Limnocylindrales bacterium]|nr:hypothetical protein [Candidatus Limnocylindrales bacterium]
MPNRAARAAFALLAVVGVLVIGAGGGSSPAAAAARGGCELSSSTCYLFDVGLSGNGSGVYATIDDNLTYTGRIVCAYGNEEQAGVCGWGYQPFQPNGPFDVLFQLRPDIGSQACDTQHCYGGTFSRDLFISGNYYESSWRFELVNPVQVIVQVGGDGQGTVTSDSPGISCPPDCDDQFPAGQEVHLTAKAANGFVFAGWGGACSGVNSGCTVTPNGPVSATATFNKRAVATADTGEATEEPTAEPATEAPTPAPATEAPTAELSAAPTIDVVATAATTPGATVDPSAAGSTGGGSNLPIVLLLVVVLLGLVGGAVFAFRRGGGVAGS